VELDDARPSWSRGAPDRRLGVTVRPDRRLESGNTVWYMENPGKPPVVDRAAFEAELDALRVREKVHTYEGDAIAAARRRLPMVEVESTTPLVGPNGQISLLDAFEGRRLLLAYYFMWHLGSQCRRAVRRLHLGDQPRFRTVIPALP
jgi:hypothetical protein